MTNTTKRYFGLFLIMLAFFTLGLWPAKDTEKPIAPGERTLLGSEVQAIQGAQVQFDWYDDGGVKVQTATQISETVTPLPIDALLEAADVQAVNYLKLKAAQLPTDKHYQQESAPDKDCYAAHSGNWEVQGERSPFTIKSTNMLLRGINRIGIAKTLKLTKTIYTESTVTSVKAPTGMRKSGKGYSWTSGEYDNVIVVTAYLEDFEAIGSALNFGVTIKGSAEIVATDSAVYSVKVESNRRIS